MSNLLRQAFLRTKDVFPSRLLLRGEPILSCRHQHLCLRKISTNMSRMSKTQGGKSITSQLLKEDRKGQENMFKRQQYYKERLWRFKDVGLKLREKIILPVSSDTCVHVDSNGYNVVSSIYQELKSTENVDVAKILHESTDIDLLVLGKKLVSFARNSYEDNKNLWDALEKETIVRMSKLDKQTLLLYADIFYVGEHIAFEYYYRLGKSWSLKWEEMDFTPAEIVQFAFSQNRLQGLVEVMSLVEQYIAKHIKEFTAPQLSLICFAFFTSNTSFRSFSTLDAIAMSIVSDLHSLELPWLTNVLKCIRHAGYKNLQFYEKIGNYLCDQNLKSTRIYNLVHIAHTYASAGISHKALFACLADAAIQLLHRNEIIRGKDLSRLVWSFSVLRENIPPVLIDSLIAQMKLEPKQNFKYPLYFVESLTALAMVGQFPMDLLSMALSEQFIQHHQEKTKLSQSYQFLMLDQCAELMCGSDYQGNRLKHMKLMKRDLFITLYHRTGLAPLLTSMIDLLSRQNVGFGFILNFSRIPDVILYVNKNGFTQPVKNSFSIRGKIQGVLNEINNQVKPHKQETGGVLQEIIHENRLNIEMNPKQIHLKSPLDSNIRKICIRVFGLNQFCLNTAELIGHHQLEINLLQKMGYEVLSITPKMADELKNMSRQECRQHVSDTILKQLDIRLPE